MRHGFALAGVCSSPGALVLHTFVCILLTRLTLNDFERTCAIFAVAELLSSDFVTIFVVVYFTLR